MKHTNPKDAVGSTKLPLWLLSPVAKAHWAIGQMAGLLKYGAWNWRAAGVRSSIYISAMERHIDKWKSGQKFDQVDGSHHLGNVMACAAILLDAEHAGKLTDDRPPSVEVDGLYDWAEGAIAKLAKQYADKAPRHYTIADTDEIAGAAPAEQLSGLEVTEPAPLPVIERRAPRPVDARAMVEAAHMMGRMAAGDDVSSDDVAAMATRLLDQAGAA